MTQLELIQLPNKDLWRGRRPVDADVPVQGVEAASATQAPISLIDKAMAAILTFSAGASELSCLWCGLQGDSVFMRNHLKAQHKSVVEPARDAEIALADAQSAREALAAATPTE